MTVHIIVSLASLLGLMFATLSGVARLAAIQQRDCLAKRADPKLGSYIRQMKSDCGVTHADDLRGGPGTFALRGPNKTFHLAS